MPHYCIYKKDKHTLIGNRADESRATLLISRGMKNSLKKLPHPAAEAALQRFRDICQEDKTIESAFATGGAFVALTVGLKAAVDSLFQK